MNYTQITAQRNHSKAKHRQPPPSRIHQRRPQPLILRVQVIAPSRLALRSFLHFTFRRLDRLRLQGVRRFSAGPLPGQNAIPVDVKRRRLVNLLQVLRLRHPQRLPVLLVGLERRRVEPREPTALPVVENHPRGRVGVRDPAGEELAVLFRQLPQELVHAAPLRNAVLCGDVPLLQQLQDGVDDVVLARVPHALDADDALEHALDVAVALLVVDDARAVDEVNAPREHDVLPDLRLARDRRDLADRLPPERVDQRALPGVGVPDDPDADRVPDDALGADLRLVDDVVQARELPQEVDEVALAEGVRRRAVHRDRRAVPRQDLQPARRRPRRDEVRLVEDEDEVLVALLPLDVVLEEPGARAHRVARVEDVEEHVGRVDDLVELRPDAAALPLAEELAVRRVRVDGALPRGGVLDLREPLEPRRGPGLEVRDVLGGERRPLALRLPAEGVREVHLALDGVAARRGLEDAVRQLAVLEDDRVGVLRLLGHHLAQGLERLGADHARVAEPLALRGDPGDLAALAVLAGQDGAARERAGLRVAADALVALLEDADGARRAQVRLVLDGPPVHVRRGPEARLAVFVEFDHLCVYLRDAKETVESVSEYTDG